MRVAKIVERLVYMILLSVVLLQQRMFLFSYGCSSDAQPNSQARLGSGFFTDLNFLLKAFWHSLSSLGGH